MSARGTLMVGLGIALGLLLNASYRVGLDEGRRQKPDTQVTLHEKAFQEPEPPYIQCLLHKDGKRTCAFEPGEPRPM